MLRFVTNSIPMISFKHKSNTRQIKIKTTRDLNERMSPWLQNIFNIKNPIVGFKVANNKYYDTESFYANKEKFYGQTVDIIEAKDQLEISFVSDNLNSSGIMRNAANPQFAQDQHEEADETFKTVSDVRSMERRLQDNKQLTIFFSIQQIYKNQIAESINLIKGQQNKNVSFYLRILPNKVEIPNYCIYVGKKMVAALNLTREYRETILMVIERYSSKLQKSNNDKNENRIDRQDQKQQQFRVSYDQQNQAPSFTTYQLQERLNQEACHDYLQRMYQQKQLKRYEFLKLSEKCQQNFAEFYRIFCEGAIDNDYENFKHQIKLKVENNLELLLSNVDEMDFSRPISREEQRRQNLKKSVSNIQIVKVENYFEILDQLKSLLTLQTVNFIKNELLDQNEIISNGFADYLSRKISKQDLASFLERAVDKQKKRPISRCVARSANRREQAYNSEDQNFNVPVNPRRAVFNEIPKIRKQSFQNLQVQEQNDQKQGIQLIKLVGMGSSGSGTKQGKNQNKQTPPMFGSSKEENNFSPIKYMSDIESNYKQAWTRLQNKADYFEPQQYGLLYYYLQTRDDSISNHVQQLQWNQKVSIEKLKQFLEKRIVQIFEQNFSTHELDTIITNRKLAQIDCIYENFKYESDLAKFISSLRAEVSLVISRSASPSPTLSYQPITNKAQVLHKKSSDSNLLAGARKKSTRKYSDEHKQNQVNSPKQSSCHHSSNTVSHAKTGEASTVYIEILNSFWADELQQMIEHCNFTEQHRQNYLRQAFKQGNPSVYGWINLFVQGKLNVIDMKQLKTNIKVREQENKYVMKTVPIFSQILRSFEDQARISDRMRKWCVVELMELNMTIIGAFECYIRTKNAQQFIDSISLAFEMQNNEMEYFRSYIKRIQNLLKSMSGHDEVSLQVFKLYPKQIKAICELYFVNGDIDDLLDSLDTLHRVETKRRQIKMATLNFSGINLNPFEYYDGSEDTKKISENMKQILATEKQSLDVKLHIIDKAYTNNLMSIRFGNKICESEHLLGLNEFSKRWKEYYSREKPISIKEDTEEIIQATMLFDYYCYLSAVKVLYGLTWKSSDYTGKDFKKIKKYYEIDGIDKLDSKVLRDYLEKKLNRPASKIEKKYQLTMEFIMKNNLDIMFLQEAGAVKWEDELVHEYGLVKGGDSVIIFRKDKFGGPKVNFYEKYRDKLNFNNDTAFYFGDRGYLLLSIHLKSNMDINIKQAEDMFNALQEIYDEHPLIKIIIGMDANHFIGGSPFNFLNFVPKSKEEFTTIKKRTFLQVQFRKSDELSRMGKDYVLSNLNIKDYSIIKINGEAAKQTDMLPSDEHPYDHFIVTAVI